MRTVHFAVVLIWVIGNSVWALGDLFIDDYDDPMMMWERSDLSTSCFAAQFASVEQICRFAQDRAMVLVVDTVFRPYPHRDPLQCVVLSDLHGSSVLCTRRSFAAVVSLDAANRTRQQY